MRKRELAAVYVAYNWRVRKRLRRITNLAYKLGLIDEDIENG